MSKDKVNGRLRTVLGIAFGNNVMSTSNTGRYTINSEEIMARNGGGLVFTESEIDEALTVMVNNKMDNM